MLVSNLCRRVPLVLPVRHLHHYNAITYKRKPLHYAESSEMTVEPEYPEIQDITPNAKEERNRQKWIDELKMLPTVQQKQVEINDQYYYGWYSHIIKPRNLPYSSLPLAKHITRTHFIEGEEPEVYRNPELVQEVDQLYKDVKEQLVQTVLLYNDQSLNIRDDRTSDTCAKLVTRLSEIILRQLAIKYTHLLEAQVDYCPRYEAHWVIGGRPLDAKQKYWLGDGNQANKGEQMDWLERNFCYIGNECVLDIRCKEPLPAYISRDAEHPVPEKVEYNPIALGGLPQGLHRAANIAGVFPGESRIHSLLSIEDISYFQTITNQQHHVNLQPGDTETYTNQFHSHGIVSGFAKLNALANQLGFTTFNDITYPLVHQTALSNMSAQYWSFYSYQLNTMVLNQNAQLRNTHAGRVNVCWGSKPHKLYDIIEDGQLKGLNDDVFKNLLKFILIKPEKRAGVDMTPYLDPTQEMPLLTDTEMLINKKKRSTGRNAPHERRDTERQWRSDRTVNMMYKHYTSRRPRHFPMPEKYLWEKIFKKNPNYPGDKRRRYFEFGKKLNISVREKCATKLGSKWTKY